LLNEEILNSNLPPSNAMILVYLGLYCSSIVVDDDLDTNVHLLVVSRRGSRVQSILGMFSHRLNDSGSELAPDMRNSRFFGATTFPL
jgi:hypothetical protein